MAATILIVEDEHAVARGIQYALQQEGYEVTLATSGEEGLELATKSAPDLILLDVRLPGMDGFEVLRRLRASQVRTPILILSGLAELDAKIKGLGFGADDYLTKPFDARELRARVHVGERILGLQQALADRVVALEQALTQVKQLEGLLPICAWCHKIRDDGNGTHWQSVERYVSARSDARFTHTICPDCRATVMPAPFAASLTDCSAS